MKKIFLVASLALAVGTSFGQIEARGISDLGLPLIQVPFIQNPDVALPDFEAEVTEPKAETSMNVEAVLNEDKDRQTQKRKRDNQ
jgi:hypothetical protein